MDWHVSELRHLLSGSRWWKINNEDLIVSGVSTYAPTYRSGDAVFLRAEGSDFGISKRRIAASHLNPALLIIGPNPGFLPPAQSIVEVPDQQEALFKLADAARSRLMASVIGVTGSSGKTTVTAMIAHCLAGAGPVHATRFGANMARGVAWNLCCAPTTSQFCVLEMAIGKMRLSTQIARPDIAVFTNIHASHLIYHKDTFTIAARKARIFEGMAPGSIVVINAQMNHAEEVMLAARARGLQIISYGWSPGCDVCLVKVQGPNAVLNIRGQRQVVPLAGLGARAADNSMAVSGVLAALDLPVEGLMGRLKKFRAEPGRGALLRLPLQEGEAQILDHSYNANPASMRAAIEELTLIPCTGRRLVVLGDMTELGDRTVDEHRRLLEDLHAAHVDGGILIGGAFAKALEAVPAPSFTLMQLKNLELSRIARPGDVMMIKGSNSSGLFRLMNIFR